MRGRYRTTFVLSYLEKVKSYGFYSRISEQPDDF